MKITKIIAIGLFVVAMVLNVSVYVDSGNSPTDLSIGDLQVSLFKKAYASSVPGGVINACYAYDEWCCCSQCFGQLCCYISGPDKTYDCCEHWT